MDLFRMFGVGGGQQGYGGGGGGMGFPVGLGGMVGQPAPSGPFKATYRCYPVVMMASKESLESGDKIILPASALDQLARLRVTYPMMFSLVNPRSRKESKTHCGVMEFSAEEGTAYVPYWMMQNLLIESGGLIEVTNVSLKKGTYVKLQPHSIKFTQLHNPRVVSDERDKHAESAIFFDFLLTVLLCVVVCSLERALRNFSCLTKGDTIAIQHGSENFYLDVREVRPADAVSIIETDMNVDFEAPKDAPAQPSPSPSSSSSSSSSTKPADFIPPVSSNLTAGAGVTAAQRDFSSGGWGSSGVEDEVKVDTPVKTTTSGSDYFAKLGSGNKLVTKGRKVSTGTSASSSSSSSALQPSPSPSPTLTPSTSNNSLSSSFKPTISSTATPPPSQPRPQSALAGRSGGYSLAGGSSSRPPAPTSSSSSVSSRPTTAVPSAGSTPTPTPVLPVVQPKTIVIEQQGAWMYHYELDGKGGKKLVRRLPAKKDEANKPPTATTTKPTATSASSSSSTSSGLAALGPGHSLLK